MLSRFRNGPPPKTLQPLSEHHLADEPPLLVTSAERVRVSVYVCVGVFIKLHITARSGPDILGIYRSSQCVCVCVCYCSSQHQPIGPQPYSVKDTVRLTVRYKHCQIKKVGYAPKTIYWSPPKDLSSCQQQLQKYMYTRVGESTRYRAINSSPSAEKRR